MRGCRRRFWGWRRKCPRPEIFQCLCRPLREQARSHIGMRSPLCERAAREGVSRRSKIRQVNPQSL